MEWITKLMRLFLLLIETAISFKYLIGLSLTAGIAGFSSFLFRKFWRYDVE